jgi:hypothetical protein
LASPLSLAPFIHPNLAQSNPFFVLPAELV